VTTELILVALCIVVQGLFSGSEIAIVGSDRLVLRSRAESGDRAAIRVLKLLENPTRVVGTCLLGTNLATIAGATLVANMLHRLGDVPELLVVAVYTPLTIVFSEMVPKSIFQQHANTLAPLVARPLAGLSTLLRPALWAIEGATLLIMNALGVKDAHVHTVRREDIQLLLDNAGTTDIQEEEKEMILRVFNFSETEVADAMVPLIEVVALPDTATCGEARAVMVEQGFSRLPVYRKRIDRIVGMVTHSDLLFSTDDARPVGSVVHELMFVPETKRVDQLFLDLRRKRQRIAIAVDEYGGAVGIITAEDLLEEIVGDIHDETDRSGAMVRRTGERTWLASGRAEGEHLEAAAGLLLPEGQYETLAGFLLARLGRIPQVGDGLTVEPFRLSVTKASDRAILEVLIERRAG
jgi:putative hemolysin